MADVFSAIAEDRRAAALAAIASATDPASVTGISPVTGGASKASTLRIDADSGAYLLRLEVDQRGFRNPRRSYPCLRAAAAAGIAPAVHHADEEAGVVLMDFVVERPLTEFPGGEPALLRTLGEMVARLQATAPFPPVMKDFGMLVEAMLHLVRDGGLFAPGVLDGHVAGLARVRAEYPWAAAQVSAHTTSTRATSCSTESGCGSSTGKWRFATTRSPTSPTSPTTSPTCPTSTRSSSRAGWAGHRTTTPGAASR